MEKGVDSRHGPNEDASDDAAVKDDIERVSQYLQSQKESR